MRIALYGKQLHDKYSTLVNDLIKVIMDEGGEVIVHQTFAKNLKNLSPDIKTFSKHKELVKAADFLFSIGGDGTLLDTIALVRDSGLPVLGINTGRLGFLSSIQTNQIKKAIKQIKNGSFSLDKRSMIELVSPEFDKTNLALNELAIQKRDSSAMITIHAYLDGNFLNSYWADGLIISTPTGATAYSLSCGGPIVSPESSSFVITPIAPHNLNVRPLVIGDEHEIELKISGRSNNYLVSMDSRSKRIDTSVDLVIKKASQSFNIIRLDDYDYYANLRSKLNWGLDQRN